MHGNGLELETGTGTHRVLDRHAAWQWIQRRLAEPRAQAADTAPDELTATVDQYFEEYFFE